LTVGLAVHNGERFLAESLESLLGQSFEDYELVISDNASTDGTADICRRYEAADDRIRYVRQPANIGSIPNHRFLIDEARGEFFKWASHDDLYGRDLLTRCVEVLDARQEVVLSHVDQALIDHRGGIIERYDYTMATGSPSAPERLRSYLWGKGGDDEYGVFRTAALRLVRRYGAYHHPGRPFLAELLLRGPFHHVRDLQYFRRDHRDRSDRDPTIQQLCANLDPARRGHSTVRLLAEYYWGFLAAISRVPMPATQRARSLARCSGVPHSPRSGPPPTLPSGRTLRRCR
jgi:glycosyltransferase involved in cell wall biosynthesis